MSRLLKAALWVAAFVYARGQSPPEQAAPVRIGPGITPPRVLRKVEPEYSPLARADRVQGSAVFQIIINDRGIPQDIQVISPLGFGLDEKAEEAIQKWRFAPGMKEGKPIPVVAQVEVNFRFPKIWFDAKAERRRTSYNVAVKNLDGTNDAAKSKAVESVQELAKDGYAPALYLAGKWKLNGDHNVAQNTSDAWMLIHKAADQNYGPALYEVALRSLKSDADPENKEKQLQILRDAAVLGSVQAQYYLGQAYESGVGVAKETARAGRYYRLCATKGEPFCQFRLGRLLLEKPDRTDDNYIQGLAWLQLAADQKITEAQSILDREQPQLSASIAASVQVWKKQLSSR
jgi:TonB family protein